MVISFSNDIIFLRVPKNASSSLAEYFVKNYCNDQDIWTAVNDCGIRNHGISNNIIKKYSKQTKYIHLTLQEIVDEQIISKEQAQKMKKIIVLRNPLHRQLSLYFFLSKLRRTKPTVKDFQHVFRLGKHESDINNEWRQMDYVKLDGCVTDNVEIWKYEDIANHIQFPIQKHKSDKRPQTDINLLVEEYYDNATKEAVIEYYKEDIEKYHETD